MNLTKGPVRIGGILDCIVFSLLHAHCQNIMCQRKNLVIRELPARIQNCLSEGVRLWEEGGSKYHYKRAIIGPPAKRHLNGVSLACRWWPNIECWLGSFKIFQGIRTSIARNPIFLWFFIGGGGGGGGGSGPPISPPLDQHMELRA